ncbi:Craniofacial development protein 2 [Nymphon striatum]|nr:Craniofacial development protein 2 [Nymphon striatum]
MDLAVAAVSRIVPEDVLKNRYPKLDRLTRQDVLELVALADSNHLSRDKVASWIKNIFIFNNWEWPSDCKMLSVRCAVTRLRAKCKTFKRVQPKKQFLSVTFKIPKPNIKRKSEEDQICEVPVKRAHAEKITPTIKYKPKYVNYRLGVKNKQIKQLRERVAHLQNEQLAMECLKEENEELKKKAKRISSCHRMFKHRKNKDDRKDEQLLILQARINDLQTKLVVANNQITYLILQNDTVEDELLESKKHFLETKCDGKSYNSDVNIMVYNLALLDVSVEHIPIAIKLSAQFAKCECGPLPDESTCRRIIHQMGEMSRMHVSEVLSGERNTTLKYDGTSLKRMHLGEYQIETKSQTFTLGIKPMARGTGVKYAQGVNEVIGDMISAAGYLPGEDRSQNIMGNISNTMTDRHVVNKKTDRHVVNKKTNSLLEEQIGHALNSFFCGMHPLDTFAKTCDEVLKEWEKDDVNCGSSIYHRRSESTTQALIKATGKLFHQANSGIPDLILDFMVTLEKARYKPERIVGNRFHILFKNGGCLYFLGEDIVKFLKKKHGCTNPLHTALVSALQQRTLLIGCRALGLLGKCFTGPWMRLVEGNKKILELNPYYREAELKLSHWIEHPVEVLRGQGFLFRDVEVKKDAKFHFLTKPCELDGDTGNLLVSMMKGILRDLKRQLADQLPDGVYWKPDAEVIEQAQSCIGHNISGERVFALVDKENRRAPNASPAFVESKVVTLSNKTLIWLKEKGSREVIHLILAARKAEREAKIRNAKRAVNIHLEKLNILAEKEQKLSKTEENRRNSRENILTLFIRHGGLWKSVQEINSHLCTLTSDAQKICAIKNQIKVRKEILEQKVSDSSLFCFSKDRRPLKLSDLKKNLVILTASGPISEDGYKLDSIIENPDQLVGKTISHLWSDTSDDGEVREEWWKGKILGLETNTGSATQECSMVYDRSPDTVVYLELDELLKSVTEGAKNLLPTKSKEKKKEWMTDEILEMMQERKKYRRNSRRYAEKDNEIKLKRKETNEQWWIEQCEEIEELDKKHQSREMHNRVKDMTNKRKGIKGAGCIADKDGNIFFDEETIKERWVEYIRELYDDQRGEIPDIGEITGTPITKDEVECVIKSMKDGKAGGRDELSAEMLKALDQEGVKRITDLCNDMYNTGYIPDEVKESVFIALPKKHRTVKCNEHRTISLMSHVLKVLLKIIQKRNVQKIDNEISYCQSGFRSQMGTREGIFNIRTICERYIDVNKDIYACFIDYEKAFDRVNHTELIECLKKIARSHLTYGCHEWRSTATELAKLSTTYKRFLRSMIINGYKRVNPPNPSAEKSETVDWSYAIRDTDLFSITQTDSIELFYAEQQHKWIFKLTCNWPGTVGKYGMGSTNDRGVRLLEFANLHNMVVANTRFNHKKSRRVTWTAPDGITKDQIDYILVEKRCSSSINGHKTRSFRGADIGSDHNLTGRSGNAKILQNTNCGRYAPLLEMTDMQEMTDLFTNGMNEVAQERKLKQPWITAEILKKCDERRTLKPTRYKGEDCDNKYRAANRMGAKEKFLLAKCQENQQGFENNNSKMAYEVVKQLTKEKTTKVPVIEDAYGKWLTETGKIQKRWNEYIKDSQQLPNLNK